MMKRIFAALLLMCAAAHGASTSAWQVVQVNTGTYAVTPSQSMSFGSTVSASDPVNTYDLVTLNHLNRALGTVSVFYASTNQTLVAGYYDARTFLPTHPAVEISVAGVTNNQYVGQWVSNTNLVNEIRSGIGVITARMRLNNPLAGKTLVVKPEIYRRTVADGDIELCEISQQITLNNVLTDYTTDIDCSTNCTFAATDRAVVKWKVVSQTGNPTWYFECGTPNVIAVRLPVTLGGGADAVTIGTAQTVTGAKVLSAFNGTLNGNLMAAGNTISNAGVVEATNVVMRGNIALNGNWLSGDGGNEGLAVSSAGLVGIGTLSPSYSLHVIDQATGQSTLELRSSAVALASSFRGVSSRGTPASPATLQADDAIFNCAGGVWAGGSSWTTAKGVMSIFAAENHGTNVNQGTYITFRLAPTNSTTLAERIRITTGGDLQINANNGNLVPATIAGACTIFVTNATSARILNKRGDGTVTLMGAHNDKGESIAGGGNEYTGINEEINLTLLARTIEEMLPTGHALKGKLYQCWTNPPKDWRENEDRQAAAVIKAQQRWTPEDGAFPAPYIKRPVPSWAATAQKQFDHKYAVEAEK